MATISRPLMIMVVLLSTYLTACKSTNDDAATADLGTSPGAITGTSALVIPPTISAAVPLGLTMFSTYDQTSFNNQLLFAQNGTSTANCTVTSNTHTTTCTVTVPEGRLYFSKLTFAFSWLPSSCKLMTFAPYSYQASNSATYFPPGTQAATDSPIDCTALPIATACFGGAAKYMVTGFPKALGLIYLPDETSLTTPNSKTLTLPSGYSSTTWSNRQSVNDLLVTHGTGAIAPGWDPKLLAGDGFVPGTYQDYQLSCRDDWYDPQPYVINLNIRDEDSAAGNPTEDDWYTWKEAPP